MIFMWVKMSTPRMFERNLHTTKDGVTRFKISKRIMFGPLKLTLTSRTCMHYKYQISDWNILFGKTIICVEKNNN